MRAHTNYVRLLSYSLVLILVSFILLYGYLYIRGLAYYLYIPNTDIIVSVGKKPQSSYPPELDQSFVKNVVANRRIQRVPKFEHNVIIDGWEDGKLSAHDYRTGKKNTYFWIDETAYLCVDSRRIKVVDAGLNNPHPDPKNSLENFKFFFWDDGLRGDLGRSGFFHFDADVESGLPAKLILVSDKPNDEGGYWLVNVFLFVTKDCADFSL